MLLGVLVALIGGGLNAIQNRAIKVLSPAESTMAASIKYVVASLLLGGALLYFVAHGFEPATLTPTLIIIILASVILETVIFLLLIQAFARVDQSVGGPLFGMTIVFALPISVYWLGEILNAVNMAGIGLVFLGGIVIGWSGVKKIFEGDPEHQKTHWVGIAIMLLAAFGASVYVTITRYALVAEDITPYELSFYVGLGLTLSYGIIAYLRAKKANKPLEHKKQAFLYGSLFSLNPILHYIGLALLFAPLFIAIKRSSLGFDVLIGCLLGKESHLAQRLTGAGIIFLGIVLIAMG